MKTILLISCLFYNSLFAQQIFNGGFETWTDQHHAQSWRCNIPNTETCYPPVSFGAIRTSDSHNGNWAAELIADTCYLHPSYMVFTGFIIYGDSLMPYTERPAQLNFFYKFQSVGNDTGFALIRLNLLDSSGLYPGTLIGEGKASIVSDTNVYTLMSAPIQYYLTDTPQVIQIIFSTSKTLADRQVPLVSCDSGGGAYAGTTLWIDDVSVSGGTLNIGDNSITYKFKVSPNPATNLLTITTTSTQPSEIILFDITSRQLMQEKFSGSATLNIENLAKGVYLYEVRNENGVIKQGKVVKE